MQTYFAWADANETTFGVEHQIYGENIQSWVVDHAEGDFPKLTVKIKNPRVGLLSAGRKLWAWLSVDDGSDVTPVFFGQLVGVPDDILGEIVTVVFIAKPTDYGAQRIAVANALKVAPNYDPVFIDDAHRDDLNAILEGYSALPHFDRITLAVTTSDILVGEDGLEEFAASEIPYSSVAIRLNQGPKPTITVRGQVSWTQKGSGQVDLGSHSFQSYSGDGYLSDFPKPGATLQNGWTVADSTALDVNGIADAPTLSYSYNYTNKAKEHYNGDVLSISASATVPAIQIALQQVLTLQIQNGLFEPYTDPQINIPPKLDATLAYVPLWKVDTTLTLSYEAERPRSEVVSFTLNADLQQIITQPDDGDTEIIEINGTDVGLALDDGETDPTVPIGDLARFAYFTTSRGIRSVEYLLCVARAHLLARSRVVEISFNVPFERVLSLSCRKNASVADPRIPGGTALGKIIAYSIKSNDTPGLQIGSVTIACAIGYGNAIEEVTGDPDYVDDDYVDDDYQTFTGSTIVLPAGDIGYTPPVDADIDDGLRFPLTKGQVLVRDEVMGATLSQQGSAIGSALVSMAAAAKLSRVTPNNSFTALEQQRTLAALNKNSISNALQENPRWREIELKPLNVPFDAEYDLDVTSLTVPQGINLEAA